MDLSAYNVWALLVQIGIIAIAILAANTLRRKIKLISNSLLPSSVIAGIIIFALKFIPCVSKIIDSDFMEILTYHCLGLGFIALSLKASVKKTNKNRMVVVDTGITTVNGYLVQGIVGLGLTLLMSKFIFKDLFFASGLLLPMGFGQGTGQALNVGTIFSKFGFIKGPEFGLAIAAIGFLVACIVGVIYLNYLKRKGKLKLQEQRIADNTLDTNIYVEDEAPLSESIDKLTIQIGFVLGLYLVTYLIILGTTTFSGKYLGNFGNNTINPLLWGFNFLIGSVVAMVAKIVVSFLRKKKIMTHTYINSYMMTRLSGLFFDIMIVAGIAAIDWQDLEGLLLPLVIICSIGGAATFFYLKFICKRIFPDYEYEGFFSMFGMLTGTASTGMILLREIDPNYETPAANNLVLQQVPAIAFGAPILLLMSFAAGSFTNSLIVFGILIFLFIVYNMITLRNYIFKKKNKNI